MMTNFTEKFQKVAEKINTFTRLHCVRRSVCFMLRTMTLATKSWASECPDVKNYKWRTA